MKTERGICGACGHKTAVRDGEATDGRPQYRCLEGRCGQTWTKGYQGEVWDTQSAPTRDLKEVNPFVKEMAKAQADVARRAAERSRRRGDA